MNEYQINQIMQCPVPMQACFFDFDEEEIVRQDVICLAVIRCIDTKAECTPSGQDVISKETNDFVVTMVGDKKGYICDATWLDGFLGVEYDGKTVSWDSEIREMLEEIKNSKTPSKPKLVS